MSPEAPSNRPPKVSVRNLNFYYGNRQVLFDNNLDIADGKVTAFIGPSGCGKSTHIRTYNRMFDLYKGQRAEGEIIVDDTNILDPKIPALQLRHQIGMIFQKPTPFPMSIYDNIAFGVRLFESLKKRDMDERVESALRKAALWEEVKDILGQNGHSLSGGQQQRLCIARGIAVKPEILLLDEPTSALDPEMIKEVLDVMIALAEEGMTMICVTHEMGFAKRVADKIVFMDGGTIVETAAPAQFFTRPQSERAQLFLSNILGH